MKGKLRARYVNFESVPLYNYKIDFNSIQFNSILLIFKPLLSLSLDIVLPSQSSLLSYVPLLH